MKYEFELLIDDDLYRLFDDFRAFRHKFRHLYSFELDWERECIVHSSQEISSDSQEI
mgnify:CR=1 FL=1